MRIKKILFFVLLMAAAGSCWGISGADMAGLMDSIEVSKVSEFTIAIESPLVITKQDFTLTVDSGWCSWFAPVVIDSVTHYYALYISGHGVLQFAPTPKVERGQLIRFFDTDTLNREFTQAVILMGDSTATALRRNMTSVGKKIDERMIGAASDFKESLTGSFNRQYIFTLLRSLTHPTEGDLLTVYTSLNKGGRVCYQFDPWDREEISFAKRYQIIGSDDPLEIVCSYAVGATGIETSLNGTTKGMIDIKHYDIDASIDNYGVFRGAETVTFKARTTVQALSLYLHHRLEIDSVVDNEGHPIAFKRYHHIFKSWWGSFYLFLDEPVKEGDSASFTIYCHGDIADRTLSYFYVTASIYWYPQYSSRQSSTFAMRFRTPKHLAFVATGEQISKEVVKDTAITTWVVSEPTQYVSFSIGLMEKFEFNDTLIGKVDVYYSKDIHDELASSFGEDLIAVGSHMERQVGNDMVNAFRLFTSKFGALNRRHFSVSETFLDHGEAYPGFIHLGFFTWINTDAWGNERMFRAHEAAHQWWGLGVDHQTYHDRWLSEGISEYCGYIYLQAVAGNKTFLDRLKESRKEVVAAREKPTDSSSAMGPIILGYRSSSSKSESDASLMIYQKGAHVLHMIRNMLIDWKTMDESRFFSMMKEYYETYRGKTATTADFQRMVEKYMGEEMTWFFDEWVYGTEIPTYKFSYTIEPGENKTFTAKCHVVTEGVSPDFRMYVPVEIQIDEKRKAYVSIGVVGTDYTFTLPGLPVQPKKLVLNPFESVLAEVKQ